MKVGFTGTRKGMTEFQRAGVRKLLAAGGVQEAHHGDCVGADAEFHDICLELEIPVVLHPPADGRHRAFCRFAQTVNQPLPYLERNAMIVDAADFIIGAPKGPITEALDVNGRIKRGEGTWWTIRKARDEGVRMIVIPPTKLVDD